MTSSRRAFLRQASLAAASSLIHRGLLFPQSHADRHAEICKQKFEYATSLRLSDNPVGDVVAAVGLSFLDAPYKAHTLEIPGTEHLVVNLKEFDCVTFVETSLALARCIKLRTTTFEEFKKQLRLIRYRGGIINGYPSRLHYFSDWIHDNEQKGVVKNISRELGGVPFDKNIDYMSTHRRSYRQLANKQSFNAIKKTEAELRTRQHFYLPKQNIQPVTDNIFDGDIIAITTPADGLDISHTGLACRFQGYLRFLHAPLSTGTVQITKRTIVDHLGQSDSRTGIILARPEEPVA